MHSGSVFYGRVDRVLLPNAETPVGTATKYKRDETRQGRAHPSYSDSRKRVVGKKCRLRDPARGEHFNRHTYTVNVIVMIFNPLRCVRL